MRVAKIIEYMRQARTVERHYGVSIVRQFSGLLALRFGPGRIGPGDYYAYRLFEPDIPTEEKYRFIGWQAEAWLDSLNDPRWHCLGLDKVLMYALLRDSGIPIPETIAIFLPGRKRILSGTRHLGSEAELHQWLRDFANYPFFSKPSASGFGRGSHWAVGYDPQDDSVNLIGGRKINVEQFSQSFRDMEKLGYLFQVPLVHDPRLIEALGFTPSSLRIMILIDEKEGPLIHRAFWKMPTGYNHCDNFDSGKSGNIAASLELDTGRVVRAISSAGIDLQEVRVHPDSGIQLGDMVVPDWNTVKDFAADAALILPKLGFQQWDIALTDRGPVALEVNLFGTGGGDLTQVLYRKGLLDNVMLRFLKRNSHSLP